MSTYVCVGMPSLLGALISIIMSRVASPESAAVVGFKLTPREQAANQLGGLIFCFVFAILSGMFTGKVMTMFGAPKGVNVEEFHDAVWWEIGGGEYEHGDKPKEEKELKKDDKKIVHHFDEQGHCYVRVDPNSNAIVEE